MPTPGRRKSHSGNPKVHSHRTVQSYPRSAVCLRNGLKAMVGTAGFEPATPCTQNRCATKLRHVPNCPLHSEQLRDRAAGNCLSLGEIAASRGVSLLIEIQHHCGARNRAFAAPHLVYSFGPERFIARARECSSMVEPQPSKLLTRVRFPSLAPRFPRHINEKSRALSPRYPLDSVTDSVIRGRKRRTRLELPTLRPMYEHPNFGMVKLSDQFLVTRHQRDRKGFLKLKINSVVYGLPFSQSPEFQYRATQEQLNLLPKHSLRELLYSRESRWIASSRVSARPAIELTSGI